MNIKKLIISITILFAHFCYGQTFATAENISKGKILLTIEDCKIVKLKNEYKNRMYNYTPDGQTEEGCWKYDSSFILGEWEYQGIRRYPINYFTLEKPYSDFHVF